jgi:twitching motility protein PilT
MEIFKKALKQAIQEKAEAVRMEDGQHPQLLHFSSEKPLLHLPVMNLADVQALIESLVANGEPLGNTARESVLAIVNYGELKLIAQLTTPLKLYAFIPPQGNQMHQQIRNQILGPAKPLPTSIEMPSVLDEPFGDRGHFALSPAEQEGFDPSATAPRRSLPVSDDIFNNGASLMPDALSSASLPPEPMGTSYVPSFEDSNPMPSYLSGQMNPGQRRTHPTQLSRNTPEFGSVSSEVGGLPFDSNLSLAAHLPLDSMSPEASESNLDYHYNGRHDSMGEGPDPSAVRAPLGAAPSAKPIIHFGASIPGETIDRGSTVFALDAVLQDMIKRKASDLHLTQGEKMCMRIDGEITRVGTTNLTEGEMKQFLLPIMPSRNIKEFSEVSDTDFAYEVPGLARFRVNIFRDRMGVGAVLRQIPEKILSADELSLPPAVRKFCELSKGLVVVTGPTGSGKSTTLAGMVDLINDTRHEHILTIEDPIEFVHKQKTCLINQREVHRHTQSFSRALRAALREDPDIILIGEMRDLETVEIAIETAETGHLVFGTLHTNTAISTVDRLIDQFPADQQAQIRVMLAESLKGVVAQTLVRKKGGGRVAALEILVVDKAVASLIREGNTHMMGNHMQTQKAKGNIMLNESLLTLVVKGVVDAKDAYMKAVEKEAFLSMLQAKGINLEVQKAS